MAVVYPTIENIERLKVAPTEGELFLVKYLQENLDDSYEVFFNPYLDGDRPDIIILKRNAGAFIIEIKDWNLSNHFINENNQWFFSDGVKASVIRSPQYQVFKYKKNLYDLHLPVVGLKSVFNPNFYNLVNGFTYFHKSNEQEIKNIYSHSEKMIRGKIDELNCTIKSIVHDKGSHFSAGMDSGGRESMRLKKLQSQLDYWIRKRKQLNRDKGICFTPEKLNVLINKVTQKSKNILFDDDVYQDFKRRLSPSQHTLKQGIPIAFDKKQSQLIKSEGAKSKVKGVAGCGKTSIMAQRAINSFRRHNSTVLILTYNITLKNYIRDKISDIQGCRDFKNYEVSNYHQFFNSQLNNLGLDAQKLIDEKGVVQLYKEDVFKEAECQKYSAILLDEIQDYEKEWVKIIRDNFLETDGEMVLFGDEAQNIYHRDAPRASVIAQGFGRWNKLTRSYRTDFESPLNQLFKSFQLKFLTERYDDSELFDTPDNQLTMNLSSSLLKYVKVSSLQNCFDVISKIISLYSFNPNDVVILSSKIHLVRRINELFVKNEKTSCMFDTYEELAANDIVFEEVATNFKQAIKELNTKLSPDEFVAMKLQYYKKALMALDIGSMYKLLHEKREKVESIRRIKKNHFYPNSGLIKLSTVHSFKGLECQSVFYLMDKDDNPEMVYTAITRSTENLVILDIRENECSDFLRKTVTMT